MQWEMKIRSAAGGAFRRVHPDNSFIHSNGFRLTVLPNGDCVEGSFVCNAKDLMLGPLDTVQFVMKGHALFCGEVRVGGNQFDGSGNLITLRGLRQCLYETHFPQGLRLNGEDVNELLSELRRLFARGLLKDKIDFSSRQKALVGFKVASWIEPRGQSYGALLDKIAEAAANVSMKLKWGVDGLGRFFMEEDPPRNKAVQDEDLRSIRWEAPSAEQPCTVVRWVIETNRGHISHLSHHSAAERFGQREKSLAFGRKINVVELPMSRTQKVDEMEGCLWFRFESAQAERLRVEVDDVGKQSNFVHHLPPGLHDVLLDVSDYGKGATSLGEINRRVGDAYLSWRSGAKLVAAGHLPKLKRFDLDGLAEQHFAYPTTVAGEMVFGDFLPPHELPAELTFRREFLQVETWEYRLSTGLGFERAAVLATTRSNR